MDPGREGAGPDTTPPSGKSSGGWELSKAAREVRLGLVVYGGVSLAIYINGVADELFRSVRGRGVYKLLKRLLDADIIVDIISGTSAGGINGLFLAYALTNEREFSDCAALWREQGALAKLLRLIDDDVNATSLLDSTNYYLPQLERAFRMMGGIAGTTLQAERPSRFDELDLFVTGTNFEGQLSTAVDATGRRIDIKTHRTVFHLKHRAGRKTPFAFALSPEDRTDEDRARVAALARLAAITSSFPAAFEPVKVAPGHPETLEHQVFEWLRQWGGLDGETWFLDGGVLDNKPFSYTIQEIFNRTASRPVDRKLLYVEPDPERFNLSARPPRVNAPNVVESAVQALFGIPGYESIAEDLQQIVTRNDRLERLTGARAAAERALSELKSSGAPGAETIPPSVAAIYKHTRLAQLGTRALLGLIENEGFRRSLRGGEGRMSKAERDVDQRRRETASALAQAFKEWEGDGDVTLQRYDVYVRRRRLFHLIYRVFGQVSNLCDAASRRAPAADEAQSLKVVWEKLNEQLGAYDIVQWAMENALDAHPLPENVSNAPGAASQVWRMLAADLDRVLFVDPSNAVAFEAETFSDARRQALHDELKTRFGAGARAASGSTPAGNTGSAGPNLLERLDEQTARIIRRASEQHPAVAAAWADFEWHDAHFFPIDYFGDLSEKDAVDVVRVSPVDAERAFSSRSFEDKITGETVMHFGAFLKKSWRSNDIMWGRLDGACRILDALLTPEALRRAVTNAEVRELLRRDLDRDLNPGTLFPGAGRPIQSQIAQWLRDLASDDEVTRERAIADREKHDLLLWCAQLEILHESLPTVLEDAATEQLEWNNRRADRGFKATGVRIDRATAGIIGRHVTQDFIRTLREDPSEFTEIPHAPIARYFLKQYEVGAERVQEDIPPAVLVETLTAASLVARNCLLKAFPEQAVKLRSNLLYIALVQWPLVTAHTLAVLARRERTFYLAGLAALLTYAVLALVGGMVWLRVDVSPGERIDETRVIVLIVLPLLILTVGGYMSWLNVIRHAGRAWSAVLVKIGLFVVSAAAIVPILLAFGAAWSATNETLRQWFASAPDVPWAQRLLPDAFLRWLAHSVSGDGWGRITFYPLAELMIAFLVLVPMCRGFIQSRVARRTARFAIGEATERVFGKSRQLTRAAHASVREQFSRAGKASGDRNAPGVT